MRQKLLLPNGVGVLISFQKKRAGTEALSQIVRMVENIWVQDQLEILESMDYRPAKLEDNS